MKKLLLLIPVILVGCASTPVEGPTMPSDPIVEDPTEIVEELPSNIIDFSRIEVGDILGGMTVSEIEIYSDDPEEDILQWNSAIDFVGEVTFMANYEHTSDENPFFGDLVCLSDIEHGDSLPLVEEDYRSSRLCFTNQDLAQELLNTEPGDSGRAEFTISSYTWIGLESEVVNAATLVGVSL